ncbi:hypothetical protein B0O99DRAFT_684046 [Bisporella sp. PMI_857]|nr:hypothetical protein B0O99DRAFT_684046 [Bisporella sp. PMI_857]
MAQVLQVVAIFNPTPGKESRLKEVLLDLADQVYTNEPGVLKYKAFEQVDSQTGENVVLFEETYQDQATVDAHLSSSYFGAATATMTTEGLITKPFEIIVINPIGGFDRAEI